MGLGSSTATGAPRASADPTVTETNPDPQPRDPNEIPPLAPPNGQPAPNSLRRDVDHASNLKRGHRVMLTAAPLYASFRLPFLGRASVPVRGFGFGLAAQVPVWRPFGLRLSASHSIHPVFDQFVRDDDNSLVQLAHRGTIQATAAGLAATFAMDLGRVTPSLDAGIGALWIRSPEAVQDGQLGGTCLEEGICDTGLSCGADSMCSVATTTAVHGGFAVDVLVGDRFAVGSEIRYFALLSAPTSYPVYLMAGIRASLRF